MTTGKESNFLNKISLNTVDFILVNMYLLFCIVFYLLISVVASKTSFYNLIVEIRDIVIYALWGIVIAAICKFKLKSLSFLGIEQVNLCNGVYNALALIFLYLSLKIFIRIIFSNSMVSPEKWVISSTYNSLPFFLVHGSVSIIVGPIVEEIIFRGFFYPPLRKKYGVLCGTIISSAIFALWHIGADFGTILNLFVIGIVLAYAYEKSKSLVPCIISHSVINLNLTLIILFNYLKHKKLIIITEFHFLLSMLIVYIILSVTFYLHFYKSSETKSNWEG